MSNPLFCEEKCPVCTNARKGNAFAKFLQSIEMKVTGGGCPWGRARQEMFGYKPIESIPPEVKDEIMKKNKADQ